MLKDGDKIPAGLEGILITPDDAKKNLEGKKVKLNSIVDSEYLVLYFYPKDMTPGCTIETQTFRDLYKSIKKAGGEVVGCSKDNAKSHCKFITKENTPFALLSDPDGKICEAFGVWVEKKMYGKEYMGIHRATFIIKNGKIIKAFEKVTPKDHPQEVLDFLKSI